MFVIRKDQVAVLAKVALARFESRMLDHLRRAFPDWSAAMGELKLRVFIAHGVRAAARYGITVELDVARYLHAMQALGMDFDESAEHGWAGKVLRREDLSPQEKSSRLADGIDYAAEARRIGGG